jgi:aryl-alcohol dehydrogenase-like predicted oxidoreductase
MSLGETPAGVPVTVCWCPTRRYDAPVNQRAIGDATVTAIGIGDVDVAVADARGMSVTDVERGVNDALERGITLVDVTDDRRAQRLVGEAVRALRLRDRCVVATSIRALAELPGRARDVLPERLPPLYVQERIEASLRAIKLDALPLAFLPVRTTWCASKEWPELVGACARLTREGKVLRWGARLDLAAADREERLAEELAEAAALRDPFVALSVVYNACDRRADPLFTGALAPVRAAQPLRTSPGGLFLFEAPAAEPPPVSGPVAAPLTVLAREPLAGGTLAGAIGPGVKRTLRDDRNALDAATLERIAVGMARLAPFVSHEPPAARSCEAARAALDRAPKSEREASTVAELAIRYVLDRAIAMPRLRREHVNETIALLAAPPLSDELRERIERALDSI